jgi:hypothetical protein
LFEQFKSSGNDYEKVKFENQYKGKRVNTSISQLGVANKIFNEELMVFVVVEDIYPLPRSKRMKLHHRFNCGKNRVKGTV